MKLSCWPELIFFEALFWLSAQWDVLGSTHFWIINREITSVVDATVIQSALWLIPTLLYLRCRNPALYWSPKDLVFSRFPWRDGVILSCLCLCAQQTIRLHAYESTMVRFGFQPIFLVLAFCTGFKEELFFRGFLLNCMLKKWSKRAAVIISSLCFVLYHYPQLFFGTSFMQVFSLRSVQIFVMSVVLSASVIKSRNITISIWLHTFWNLLSYLFGLY